MPCPVRSASVLCSAKQGNRFGVRLARAKTSRLATRFAVQSRVVHQCRARYFAPQSNGNEIGKRAKTSRTSIFAHIFLKKSYD